MKPAFLFTAILCTALVRGAPAQSQSATTPLPPPGFHHLHLNSVNPEAAIDFYTRQFPTAVKATFGGEPALKAGKVWVLFTKVNTPPPTTPQTAYWHFGWHVTDVHESLKIYQQRKDVTGKKYIEFHQKLLGGRGAADKARALAVAKDVGFDMARIEKDMGSDEVKKTIDESMKLAEALGVNGTPSYVVGDEVVVGAVGLDALKEKLAAERK